MFSNDRNIETIAQLVDVLKHYIGLQTEYLKLDVIDKVVRLFTALAILTILLVVLFFVIIFLSLAAAFAMAPSVGQSAAFCIVAAAFVVLLLVFFINRKKWIERPLVRFLANILINK